MAGAIPLASMVMILLTFVPAKRRTNSTPIDFISTGSIWWLMKLSTLRIPPHNIFRPVGFFFNNCMIYNDKFNVPNIPMYL